MKTQRLVSRRDEKIIGIAGISSIILCSSFSVGETCENEQEPCEGLKYSICSRGLCQCQRGFYESSGACIAEIGMSVDFLSECGSGLILDSMNRCSCQKDFFAGLNLRTCTRGDDKLDRTHFISNNVLHQFLL